MIRLSRKYGAMRCFFILFGGQFFLNWILPTNPSSKNPAINILYGRTKNINLANNVAGRYRLAWVWGTIHIIFCWLMILSEKGLSTMNILVNIYPIIVQVYIGVRCWQLKKWRKTIYKTY